jgi:hypothetical protein
MRIASCSGVVCIAICSLSSQAAMGATASASFSVSVTVESACLVSSSANSYKTVADAMASAPAGLSVSCTLSTPYNVALTRRVASGNPTAVTIEDAVGPILHRRPIAVVAGPLRSEMAGEVIDSDRYKASPMLPMGYSIAAGKRYDQRNAPSDTIVLEVIY